MKNTLLISGSGGQGVMSIGMILAESATENDLSATFVPVYGPEQRGGTAKCTVIVSDQEVISPLPKLVNAMIAMNEKSYKKFIGELEQGGLLILNRSRVTSEVKREDVRLITLEADNLAQEVGSARTANIIMLGAYLGYTGAMDPSLFEASLIKKFAKKADVAAVNSKAFEIGVKLGEAAR
jgi:2-oxoglutarate ferredoxin oxidoreductase subunit gamma